MKIIWSPKAKKTFLQILDWLSENWSRKEVDTFVTQTEETIEQIKNNPYLYQASEKHKNTRRGLVNKIISLYYRIKPRKNEVELITFWNNRQNPRKNKYQ
ncbi:MAG: type II toxin-antitoxin system RelE/ParE family toxin [Leptospiraceae bacterium]|nr:type II toxin-antitoxin system RelE/ParE family toxin [Leptospiraceae bacterium]